MTIRNLYKGERLMKFKSLYLGIVGCAVLGTGSAMAAVSADEAAKLGGELTPLGSIAAGNADGSIPAWDPKGAPIPSNFVAGSDNYVDPYADEKPVLIINNSNWQEHKENLTLGSQALMEKLGPDGYEMHIYPTHRDFVAPDWYYENTKTNATQAELSADGQKINNSMPGVAFPIPKSGLEVMFNHMTRYSTAYSMDYDVYYVGSEGNPVLSTTGQHYDIFPMFMDPTKPVGDGLFLKLRINYLAPNRRAGEILLVHEPGADFSKGKGRKAWSYLTGQRRVRLAPAVAFDTPNPGVAGTSTYDDAYVWNGSPERYNFKLIGKKEMYVPYSNYNFVFQADVKDLLGPKYLDPKSVRWEKHRVWVVELDLKEGARHIYSKRRYYVDEDTWVALTGETYDGRGNLWRVHHTYPATLYDIKSTWSWTYGTYDILQNIYNINTKPIPGKYKNGVDKDDRFFTSKGMARGGVR